MSGAEQLKLAIAKVKMEIDESPTFALAVDMAESYAETYYPNGNIDYTSLIEMIAAFVQQILDFFCAPSGPEAFKQRVRRPGMWGTLRARSLAARQARSERRYRGWRRDARRMADHVLAKARGASDLQLEAVYAENADVQGWTAA